MRYALVQDGQIVTYPYTYSMLRQAHPDTSFPREPGAWLADWGVVEVAEAARPESSSINVNVVEGAPALVNGLWTQTWVEVPATAEQIAERAEITGQAAELDAAKLDNWVLSFLAMTPTGAQDYINNNSANLAALRANVARMAYILRVLVRREFNR
jgi:hypothetical protein